jgi:cell division cycle 2-like protein
MDAEVEDVSASESDSSSENPDMAVGRKGDPSPDSLSESSSEGEDEISRSEKLVASKFDDVDDEVESPEKQQSQQTEQASSLPSPVESKAPTPPPLPPMPKPKEAPTLPIYYPALQGCRSVDEFRHLNRIEEGTYGVVYRAKDLRTNEIVALKRLKMEKEREGFPITSLREINCLLKSQHANVVPVREIVVGSNMDKIYLVMDYVEHDLKSLMEVMKQPFLIGETKTIMIQLLRGIHHLHDNWILHRDLKASNLLFSHKGELKIGDFGLAREYGSPLKPYTPIVVTLWYRAPELLLGTKLYSKPIDLWSVGCIFGELLTQKPMFPGKSEVEQCNLIFKELGTPNEKIWPGYNQLPMVKKIVFTEYPYNNLRKRFGALLSETGFELLNRFLAYNPSRRITAADALNHDFFKEMPLPVHPSQFPTWPAKSEGGGKPRLVSSPKAPEGGAAYNNLGNDDEDILGFQLTHATHGLAKRGPGFALKF